MTAGKHNGGNNEHLIWSPEGKQVSVHLSQKVLDELRRLAVPAPGPERGAEKGGFLLGYVRTTDETRLIAVEDLHEFSIDHTRGASWILNARDLRAFGETLRKFSGPAKRDPDGPDVVGWFRTHTRPGLFLDEYDFRLFRELFPAPLQIAVLVNAASTEQQAPGGVFFWEDNDIHRSAPYQTFSLGLPAEHLVARATGGEAKGTTAAPRRFAGAHRAFLFLAIAAAGLALGLLWNPTPLHLRSRTANFGLSAQRSNEGRTVFAPPPLPEAPPEPAAPYVPPPEDPADIAGSTQAVPAPAPRVPRPLVLPPARRKTAEPNLDTPAPSIAASTSEHQGLRWERREPVVEATLEPGRPSVVRRVIGSIPGLGFLKRRKPTTDLEKYQPARAVKQFKPKAPPALAAEVPVRVRLSLNSDGEIERTELLTRKIEPGVARSAMEAARKWRFEPARLDEKPVASEVVVQFRFPAGTPGAGRSGL